MKNYLAKVFLLLIIAGTAILFYLIFKPFLVTILSAATLATIFYPLYAWLFKKLKNRASLTAILSTLIVIVLVLIPLALIFLYFTQEAISGINYLSGLIKEGYFDQFLQPGFWQDIQQQYFSNLPITTEDLKTNLNSAITKIGNFLLARGSVYVASIGRGIMNLLILVLCLFYFFRDGKRFLVRIMQLTPLKNQYDQLLFSKWKEVSYSSLLGILLAALAQMVVSGIAYAIIGLPVILFSVLSGFFSLIPLVGPTIVWLPTAIVLFLLGKTWQALFLIIWGLLIVGTVDNLVKTYVIKGKAQIHPLLIFLSVIGGLMAFGFIGIIIGPVILSIFLTLLQIYKIEFAKELEK